MVATPSHSLESFEVVGERFGVLFWSGVGALIIWSIDWIMPFWMKNAYLTFDLCFRMKSIIPAPGLSVVRKSLYLVVFMLTTALIRAFCPAERLLLVYQGFSARLVPFLFTAWCWFQLDGPPASDRKGLITSRDSAMAYTAGAWAITHPRLVWWCLVYAAVPPLFVVASLRVPYLETAVRWVLSRTVVPVLTGIPGAWDQFDIWEAHVAERLPRLLTQAWSRYQQRRPERRRLPEYQYSSLRDGEIRLLVLRSPRWWVTGVVEASIIHRPIDPSPDYEAVSYCWGSSERTDEILVDGRRFGVTKSAYDLLMARRSVWRDRVLWIDAICINQADDAEKGAQVQLMCDIYRRAGRVVVYTGLDWRARYTVNLIFELAAAQMQYQGSDVEFGNWMALKLDSARWRPLVDLFANGYFRRAWIVQEVAVAQKVELYYGGAYVPWDLFIAVYSFCVQPQQRHLLATAEDQDHRLAHGLQDMTLDNISYLYMMRPDADATGGLQWGLESLMFATARFQATDPRDRVFALLGLITDATRDLIKPDYTRSAEDVFEDAARLVLLDHPEKGPSVHLLAMAGIGFHETRAVVPSWLPDPTEERLCVQFTIAIQSLPRFRAAGESQAVVEPGHLPRSIRVRAREVDRVLAVNSTGAFTIGAVEGPHVSIWHTFRTKHAFVQSAIELCKAHADLWPAGEDVVGDRLWWALIGGRVKMEPVQRRLHEVLRAVFPCFVQQLARLAQHDDSRSFAQAVQANPDGWAEINRFNEDGSTKQYDVAMMEAAYGRCFAITTAGRLCLVPPRSETGDVVVVPLGAQTPFVVREAAVAGGAGDAYRLVGEAFVEGAMEGELLEAAGESSWFQLI